MEVMGANNPSSPFAMWVATVLGQNGVARRILGTDAISRPDGKGPVTREWLESQIAGDVTGKKVSEVMSALKKPLQPLLETAIRDVSALKKQPHYQAFWDAANKIDPKMADFATQHRALIDLTDGLHPIEAGMVAHKWLLSNEVSPILGVSYLARAISRRSKASSTTQRTDGSSSPRRIVRSLRPRCATLRRFVLTARSVCRDGSLSRASRTCSHRRRARRNIFTRCGCERSRSGTNATENARASTISTSPHRSHRRRGPSKPKHAKRRHVKRRRCRRNDPKPRARHRPQKRTMSPTTKCRVRWMKAREWREAVTDACQLQLIASSSSAWPSWASPLAWSSSPVLAPLPASSRASPRSRPACRCGRSRPRSRSSRSPSRCLRR